MRNGYNDECFNVYTVYHAIGELPQPTTANAWLDFWIRLRKSKGASNGAVQFIE